MNDDSAFFERLGHDVELEMKKQPERRVSESQMVSQSLLQSPPGNEGADDMVHIVDDITQSPVEESARVAHAMDKLEKRDKTIASLRTENKALMVCALVCITGIPIFRGENHDKDILFPLDNQLPGKTRYNVRACV